ncbi:hypothetical protein ACFV5N_11770 [Streptomyces sp. NPDC059853]|uniref:hypothetical protein n=1 Tax=Streptomyces sp. NPDC059853 TaxID=3346973 RepID=UPI00366904E5
MTDQQLLARAEHDTDWHVYIDCPEQGPLGFCAEHGGDEVDLETGEYRCDPFDPDLASRVLAKAGWLAGEWRRPVEGEDEYAAWVAPVVRVEAV